MALEVCTIMNNAVGMLASVAIACTTLEMKHAMTPERIASWTNPKVIVLLALSGGLGLGMCYFGFACQRAISATSFIVLQNTNKVAIVSIGTRAFNDPIQSPVAMAGLLIGLCGGFLYGKAEMDLSEVRAKETWED